ncbi:succinate dehydrogenase assembly factor 2, mitochondrial-like [Phymastichus coffea]|uniref:succinate dehydrogenase assembly factor 2, mitochondrial-like n=1 Tax=Phymastichus coffea TaxID=108790 RepID=UPI00273C9116|nr:succinate dehydrogenase assembly factor 2, mitochondrial-like [Phymastichus coffea]XP_058798410.1 succinate dehydrogenase assembly factor 2, mitochondrial-like [Phymastichus coffea]
MNNIVRYNSTVVKPLAIVKRICTTCIINNKEPFDELHHPKGREPSIPPYVEKEGENTAIKKARLLYQSRKRGMLENGLLLSTFAKKYLDGFNEQQLQQYDHLINLPSNDWDIFYWAVEVKPVPPEFQNEVMELLKKHVKNENRENRYAQPNLY